MEQKRICKKCLLRDLAAEDQRDLKKYLSVIHEADRTADAEYERRLAICQTCEKLLAATCEACGCYVEFRAAIRHGSCPYKKWKKDDQVREEENADGKISDQ